MELIFHFIVGIQQQMHFSELLVVFEGISRSGFLCKVSLQQLPVPVRTCSDAQQLQCMHSSVCAWPPTAAESPTEAAPRASGCLAHQDGSIVESTCAHTPGPLPAVAALRHPPCPGPGPGCPGVPSCWQQQQNRYLLQASCSTCWLLYGCWQSHTGMQTHTKISNQLP